MSITRAKQSSLRTGVTKYDNFRGGLPYTPTIGTATDGGTGTTVSVAFTGNNTAGLTYTALSTPGSLSATSTTSPITVTGLTSGTAYTFAVKATNSAGDSPYSAASNSVTPAVPSSYESIATVTGNGSATELSFTSIPGTYKSLQIRGFSGVAGGVGFTSLEFNGDSATNYATHRIYADGSTVGAGGNTARANTFYSIFNGGNTVAANSGSIIDIHDYAVSTKYKTVRSFTGLDTNGNGTDYAFLQLTSAVWMSTAAITSIKLIVGNGSAFNSTTTFALYGIKG